MLLIYFESLSIINYAIRDTRELSFLKDSVNFPRLHS